jgi:hypothetical protein
MAERSHRRQDVFFGLALGGQLKPLLGHDLESSLPLGVRLQIALAQSERDRFTSQVNRDDALSLPEDELEDKVGLGQLTAEL